MSSNLAIQNAQVVLPSNENPEMLKVQQTSVAIKDGVISAIGDQAHKGAEKIIDAKGWHLLPGVIDSQVHFREPGMTHKEDLESGTRGAALGGVTSVFEMPNTKPPTTTAEAFQDKLNAARSRIWTNIAFFIGATPDNIDQLPILEQHPNCCAVKIFMGSSTGSLLVDEDEALLRILKNGKRRVAVHAEDEKRLKERRSLVEGKNDVRLHPFWRDELTALEATRRLLYLARQAGRPVHVLHVTTAEEMELLQNSLDIATVETTPQHLTLSAPECYERLGTLAQMNPPIREIRHQEALWKAITNGTVTVLGSDHAPHTHEEKLKPHPDSPSGMTGVQTLLPIMLNHVHNKKLSLERLCELVSSHPAKIYGSLNKGIIKVGYDADLTLVDLKREQTITNSWIQSKAGWTPFDGMKVHGWPMATIIGGHIVMREGELIGSPEGQLIRFNAHRSQYPTP